ncbi:MAG: tetratricopeptide repeat protein, partial [Chromatiales bacterium]
MKGLYRTFTLLLLLPGIAQANWFQNTEQQAESAYNRGLYGDAAKLFEDPYRRGVAKYRMGDYAGAEEDFSVVEREEVQLSARFNLGNARFKQDDYQGAIEAYEAVLQAEPEHADARYNLALARTLLAESQPEEVPAEEEPEKQPQQDQQQKQQEQKEQQEQQGEQQQEHEQEQ